LKSKVWIYLISYWILFVILFVGCRKADEAKLADIDGQIVNASDLEKTAGKELFVQRERLYRLEKQKLDEYIGATLLTREAKNRNISVSMLLEHEINAKVPAITEEEIQAFYSGNKDRIRVDLDKVHDQIRDYLREQRLESRKNEFFKTLRSKAKVRSYLKPPAIFRADVATNGAPFKGAEKAAVTIVKFEDFQCPYCKTVQPTFPELLKRYDGKVRLVHKDLPLDAIHPQARQAAEAARCAGEQGKFWEYHDKLYANSPKASVEELKSYAKEVGLNAGSFDQCFTSGKFKGLVQKDLSEGAQLGLTGTPTFFINGREISGAQPVEAFAAIIDEELGQAK
jgi:protein-disulfide isomerase